MAPRPILTHPDRRLHVPCEPVGLVTPAVRALAEELAEAMYAAGGVGLAAPQLGTPLRVFVVDTSDDPGSDLRVFIDPRVEAAYGGVAPRTEGCLSLPGVRRRVARSRGVLVTATGLDGARFELRAAGLLAAAVQHELDHLDGVLLLDHREAPR